jgi:hypothetical protein
MRTKIYSLQDENGNIRYIGKTIKNLSKRFSAHLFEARNGLKNHRCNWIRSVLSRGKWPLIFLIGEVEGDGSKEEIAWIKYFREENVKLVNGTLGGEGMTGHNPTEEQLQKMSKAQKGRTCSEETRRKMSEARKGEKNWNYGKHASMETRRKLSEAQKGKYPSQETRKKLSEALKGNKNYFYGKHLSPWNFGKHLSLETRRKLSEAHKGKSLSEEHRCNISMRLKGHLVSENTRRKISESKKAFQLRVA